MLLAIPSAGALPSELSLDQLHHTAWTLKDGAPPDAWAIAQTSDGALWLGTPTGLFRFDGVRFERFRKSDGASFAGDVSVLRATADGGLWIGMRFGSIYFLGRGELTQFGIESGLSGRAVLGIATDVEGTTWAATVGGLFRKEGNRWRHISKDWSLTGDYFTSVRVDHNGNLWCAGPAGAFLLPQGARHFQKLNDEAGYGYLAELPNGEMWFANFQSIYSMSARIGHAGISAPGLTISLEDGTGPLIADRDGGLWFGIGETLGRVVDPAALPPATTQGIPKAVQRFGVEQGLSGLVRTVLEDDAGNVWVTTNRGIDRFRAPKLQPIGPKWALDATFAETSAGELWIAGSNGMMAFGSSARERLGSDLYLSSLHAPSNGPLLVGSWNGLYTFRNGSFSSVPLPAHAPDNLVQVVTTDRQGSIWVSLVRAGLYCQKNHQWIERCGYEELPRETPVTIVADDRDRIWVGYPRNRVALLEAGRVAFLTRNEGLEVGDPQTIVALGDEIWIGGSAGLARLTNGRARMVNGVGDEQFEGVSGIVFADDGSLWLNAAAGVVRIAAEEVNAIRVETGHAIEFELFDHNDGLRGVANQLRPLPSAFKDSRGRLWFSTGAGTHWIDPLRIPRNARAPYLEIRNVQAAGQNYKPMTRVMLPVGTSALDIEYTAFNLSIPDKVRFRYQLEGVDDGWQDGGTRRTAFYTNVTHGEYKFTVIAANEDGVWNTAGAAITVVVPPTYYQTLWFRLLCAFSVAVVVWMLYRMRVHQVAAAVRSRLEGRLQERERIARELHDTLLQGTQGLILSFQGIAKELPRDSALRQRMERSLDRADEILGEGRDRVQELRTVDLHERRDLPHALALVAEGLNELRPMTTRHQVGGVPRPIRRSVRHHVYQIGREALINAFKHSQGTTIEVTFDFGTEDFRLTVRDNGPGAGNLARGQTGQSRQWGVRGMQERARIVGAELRLKSPSGEGTTVELIVPASIAYSRKRGRAFWRRFIRRSQGHG